MLVVKFSDDATLTNLMLVLNESIHVEDVGGVVGWYDENDLVLTVLKTSELVSDF